MIGDALGLERCASCLSTSYVCCFRNDSFTIGRAKYKNNKPLFNHAPKSYDNRAIKRVQYFTRLYLLVSTKTKKREF